MFESGQRVRYVIEGELEHIVTSPTGLRASIKISESLSLTVPYPELGPAKALTDTEAAIARGDMAVDDGVMYDTELWPDTHEATSAHYAACNPQPSETEPRH